MKTKFLVLGATLYFIPLIKNLIRRGYYVITADWDLNSPAHQFANESVEISIVNYEELVKFVEERKIDYVISSYSDNAIFSWALLAERLSHMGPNITDLNKIISKSSFFKFINSIGGKSPVKSVISNRDLTHLFIGNLIGTNILKPIKSSGSKGINIIKDGLNLDNKRNIFMFEEYILEEYLIGTHHTVEAVVQNRELKFITITDKILSEFPRLIPIAHVVPTSLSEDIKKIIFDLTKMIIKNLDSRSYCMDLDIIVSNREVYCVDMSLRLGGNEITSLIRNAYGIDLSDILIDLTISNPIDLITSVPNLYYCVFLLFNYSGQEFKKIEIPDNEAIANLLIEYRFDDINLLLNTNGMIEKGFDSGADRLGSFFFKYDTHEDLKVISSFMKNIKFKR
jgi:biotin carboxylase